MSLFFYFFLFFLRLYKSERLPFHQMVTTQLQELIKVYFYDRD